MPIERMLLCRDFYTIKNCDHWFSPNTCPPCLAMLFFLDAIEETHNNDHPLAIYHQKNPSTTEVGEGKT
jgi:hypothetical protein